MKYTTLSQSDPIIANLIKAEEKRQKEGLELIPSENYTSASVMEAMGSVLTNKYSEGYPRKRYYGGQVNIDAIEELAQKRGLALFLSPSARDKWSINVQPYSGSPANIAVLFALLEFGDKIMGMALDQGGHLTHGHKVNFSGRAFKVASYGVDKNTEVLDYSAIAKLAKKEKPKLIISGATAYPRKIDFKKFGEIAKSVGAIHMVDISHIAGLIAGGAHQSPFPYADIVTTTTHKTLRGPRSAVIFSKKKFSDKIDKAVFPGLQGGPHDHITAGKAICFEEASQASFKNYAGQIIKNSQKLAAELTKYGFDLVSGGSDNHLILVDLTNKGIPGKVAQEVLDEVSITLNKNTVPYDPRSPFDPSGIRLGTPALTTRGMKEKEMSAVAKYINETLGAVKVDDKQIESAGLFPKFKTSYSVDKKVIIKIRQEVKKLAVKFPVPGIK